MTSLTLASIPGDARFSQPPVVQVLLERYGTVKASSPNLLMSKAAAAKIVDRASAAACAARDAAAEGAPGRSAKATRAVIEAAGPLLKRIRVACNTPSHVCHAWGHVLPATSVLNPLERLPLETITALSAVFEVVEHGDLDSIESKLQVRHCLSS
jgi:hypothetical protein